MKICERESIKAYAETALAIDDAKQAKYGARRRIVLKMYSLLLEQFRLYTECNSTLTTDPPGFISSKQILKASSSGKCWQLSGSL